MAGQSRTPGHPCLVLGSFCYTTWLFQILFMSTGFVEHEIDTVSEHEGWLLQDCEVPSTAFGLQRNPLFICQPHSVNISGTCCGERASAGLFLLELGVWCFAPGQVEVILHFLLLSEYYRVYFLTVEILVKILKLSINIYLQNEGSPILPTPEVKGHLEWGNGSLLTWGEVTYA